MSLPETEPIEKKLSDLTVGQEIWLIGAGHSKSNPFHWRITEIGMRNRYDLRGKHVNSGQEDAVVSSYWKIYTVNPAIPADKPAEKWSRERAAFAAGKRIQYRTLPHGAWIRAEHANGKIMWTEEETDEFRIHPDDDKPEPPAVKADDDGWIPWSGGDCPVDRNALIQWKCRGDTGWGNGSDGERAGDRHWGNHTGKCYDIIAYRLVNPPPAKEPVDPASDVLVIPAGFRLLDESEKDDSWIPGAQWQSYVASNKNAWNTGRSLENTHDGAWSKKAMHIIVPIPASDGWRMLGEDELMDVGDEWRREPAEQWTEVYGYAGFTVKKAQDNAGPNKFHARTKRPIPAVKAEAFVPADETYFPDKNEWAQSKPKGWTTWSEPFQAKYPRADFVMAGENYEYRPWSPPVADADAELPLAEKDVASPAGVLTSRSWSGEFGPVRVRYNGDEILITSRDQNGFLRIDRDREIVEIRRCIIEPIIKPADMNIITSTTGTGDCIRGERVSVGYNDAPPDKWRAEKAAHEAGREIEWRWRTSDDWSTWKKCTCPAWFTDDNIDYRIKPDKQDSPNQNTNINPTKTMATTTIIPQADRIVSSAAQSELPPVGSQWAYKNSEGIFRLGVVKSVSPQGIYIDGKDHHGIVEPKDWAARPKTQVFTKRELRRQAKSEKKYRAVGTDYAGGPGVPLILPAAKPSFYKRARRFAIVFTAGGLLGPKIAALTYPWILTGIAKTCEFFAER